MRGRNVFLFSGRSESDCHKWITGSLEGSHRGLSEMFRGANAVPNPNPSIPITTNQLTPLKRDWLISSVELIREAFDESLSD